MTNREGIHDVERMIHEMVEAQEQNHQHEERILQLRDELHTCFNDVRINSHRIHVLRNQLNRILVDAQLAHFDATLNNNTINNNLPINDGNVNAMTLDQPNFEFEQDESGDEDEVVMENQEEAEEDEETSLSISDHRNDETYHIDSEVDSGDDSDRTTSYQDIFTLDGTRIMISRGFALLLMDLYNQMEFPEDANQENDFNFGDLVFDPIERKDSLVVMENEIDVFIVHSDSFVYRDGNFIVNKIVRQKYSNGGVSLLKRNVFTKEYLERIIGIYD